jgi:hypothetical protein
VKARHGSTRWKLDKISMESAHARVVLIRAPRFQQQRVGAKVAGSKAVDCVAMVECSL